MVSTETDGPGDQAPSEPWGRGEFAAKDSGVGW